MKSIEEKNIECSPQYSRKDIEYQYQYFARKSIEHLFNTKILYSIFYSIIDFAISHKSAVNKVGTWRGTTFKLLKTASETCGQE